MFKLDKRLQAALDEISCVSLADIGCDHGKLSVAAALALRAERVYAVDKSEKSLQKTASLAEKYKLSDKIKTLIGDGFSPLSDFSVEQAVIAGLGARNIINILENSAFTGKLILIPHQDTPLLREYIGTRYVVEKDYIVAMDTKFYSILVLSAGKGEGFTETEINFGKNLPKTQDFLEMLKYKRKKLARLIKSGAGGETAALYEEVMVLCRKYGI